MRRIDITSGHCSRLARRAGLWSPSGSGSLGEAMRHFAKILDLEAEDHRLGEDANNTVIFRAIAAAF